MEVESLREAAIDLARTGADVARWHFGRVSVERKADETPVTEADHASQAAILSKIAERFPAHAILSEETVARPERHARGAEAAYCWVIDPIDGTRNYARGVGVYATSVAVLHQGLPVAGAVFDSTCGLVYSAGRGVGAYRGDERIRLSARGLDSDSAVAVSSFRRSRLPESVRGWGERFLLRNFGSLSLHLAWIGGGRLEGALAVEAKIWDIAAGALVIEEAGGMVSDPAGGPLWPAEFGEHSDADIPILAGTVEMHEWMLGSLLGGA